MRVEILDVVVSLSSQVSVESLSVESQYARNTGHKGLE
jgi:hypothetical protein